MRNVTLWLVVCLFALSAKAQDAEDALRYSNLTFGGTARGMGLAGAVGSLGADVTDLSVNPAGIGLYRSSEIEFTPSLFTMSDATNYFGTNSTTTESKLDVENFGLVFTHRVGESSGGRGYGRRGYRPAPRPVAPSNSKWKTVSFAIGYNRLNNFNESLYYAGTTDNSNSITNFWAGELNNAGYSPTDVENGNINSPLLFDAGLGYLVGVVGNSGSNTGYFGETPSGNILQTEADDISGYQSELDFSFGANYNNRWYFGVTLGIPTINWNANSVLTEQASDDNDVSNNEFQSLVYNYALSTAGTGINGKFGVIYRVNDFLRLGAAIHTPTYWSMQDAWNSAITADIDSAGTFNTYYSDPTYYGNPLYGGGSYNYNLVTPWRFVGSATLLFKQYGFITADYEYVDYSSAYFDFSQSGDITDQQIVNQNIMNELNPTSIFRVGAEAAIDVFRIRAGFAYYGSPYQAGQAGAGGDETAQSISGGVGVRLEHVFIDAAYVYTMTNSTYYPFAEGDQVIPTTYSNGSPYATSKNTGGNIVLTLGYKF